MEKHLQRANEQWVSDNDDYKTYEELDELFLDLLNETEIDVLGTSYGELTLCPECLKIAQEFEGDEGE